MLLATAGCSAVRFARRPQILIIPGSARTRRYALAIQLNCPHALRYRLQAIIMWDEMLPEAFSRLRCAIANR